MSKQGGRLVQSVTHLPAAAASGGCSSSPLKSNARPSPSCNHRPLLHKDHFLPQHKSLRSNAFRALTGRQHPLSPYRPSCARVSHLQENNCSLIRTIGGLECDRLPPHNRLRTSQLRLGDPSGVTFGSGKRWSCREEIREDGRGTCRGCPSRTSSEKSSPVSLLCQLCPDQHLSRQPLAGTPFMPFTIVVRSQRSALQTASPAWHTPRPGRGSVMCLSVSTANW